jgi:hypothetical protein
VQLSSAREAQRFSRPDGNDVSTEAEESAFLRSVTRKRLVKATEEALMFAKVICKLCGLAVALSFRVVATCKWLINPIIQNPVYIHAILTIPSK